MDLEVLARDIATHNTEVKTRLDANGAAIEALRKGANSGDGGGLEGLRATVHELVQKMARRPGPGGEMVGSKASLGSKLIASPEYAALVAGGCKGSARMELKDVSTITSAMTGEGGAGNLIAPDRQPAVMMPMRRLTVRSLLQAGNTTSNLIQVPVETARNLNATGIPTEGALKPQSDVTFSLVDFPVCTIAHWMSTSKQILADAPVLQAQLDTEMRYGIQFAEDQQLLFGTGANGNLKGLVPYAAPFVEVFTPASETRIDRLRMAMLQTELALYPATGFVLNPTDWAEIQLTKDSQGRYIFGDPQATGTPQMWGLPVASSLAMPAGSFLTGAFGLAAQVFDREDLHVLISTEDRDNFVRNLVTILAEERLALVVRRPTALVYGTLVAGATAATVAA